MLIRVCPSVAAFCAALTIVLGIACAPVLGADYSTPKSPSCLVEPNSSAVTHEPAHRLVATTLIANREAMGVRGSRSAMSHASHAVVCEEEEEKEIAADAIEQAATIAARNASSSADAVGIKPTYRLVATTLIARNEAMGSRGSRSVMPKAVVYEEEEEEEVAAAEAEQAATTADVSVDRSAVAINNAFVLVCAILVIIMSVPGVALFYGGLVRAKNVLSILQQCLIVFCLCMLLWFVVGYSWAFSGAGDNESFWDLLVGNTERIFLAGVTPDSLSGELSELNFVVFQGAFCAISACLIVGATAERIRFGAVVLGIALWAVFSYVPLAHMVWGQGLIEHYFAAYDFAGGTVVHINAAFAAIIAAKMLGSRTDLHRVAMSPHNLPLTYLGCGILWMGWFGFNAGSELAPDGISALAFINTVLAPAAAAMVWALFERVRNGKASTLGSASGVLAGLVAITPACAFVGPVGAVLIGAMASLVCLWGVRGFKRLTKIDDSLDVFGIHGLGAIVGALLTGIFCNPALGGMGYKGFHEGMLSQFGGQLGSVVVALLWSGVVSVFAFWVAGKLFGTLRVSRDDERAGLDLTYHGERGYNSL